MSNTNELHEKRSKRSSRKYLLTFRATMMEKTCKNNKMKGNLFVPVDILNIEI